MDFATMFFWVLNAVVFVLGAAGFLRVLGLLYTAHVLGHFPNRWAALGVSAFSVLVLASLLMSMSGWQIGMGIAAGFYLLSLVFVR